MPEQIKVRGARVYNLKSIDVGVQFLPDVTIPCPECRGSRYGKDASRVRHGGYSLPDLMAMDVNTALEVCKDMKLVHQRLQDLGLGYLTLGEETPSLSGGEAGGRPMKQTWPTTDF